MPSGPKSISGIGACFFCVLFRASHNFFAAASVATLIICGWHCATCSAASFTLWPAAMATIWNLPGLVATTSRHWRPIEPVEPSMEIRFICLRDYFIGDWDGMRTSVLSGVLLRRSKDLAQRARRKGGEKSEKDRSACRGGPKGVEKSRDEAVIRPTASLAGAQQAAPVAGARTWCAGYDDGLKSAATNSKENSKTDSKTNSDATADYWGRASHW
jgi:hypothetical protein